MCRRQLKQKTLILNRNGNIMISILLGVVVLALLGQVMHHIQARRESGNNQNLNAAVGIIEQRIRTYVANDPLFQNSVEKMLDKFHADSATEEMELYECVFIRPEDYECTVKSTGALSDIAGTFLLFGPGGSNAYYVNAAEGNPSGFSLNGKPCQFNETQPNENCPLGLKITQSLKCKTDGNDPCAVKYLELKGQFIFAPAKASQRRMSLGKDRIFNIERGPYISLTKSSCTQHKMWDSNKGQCSMIAESIDCRDSNDPNSISSVVGINSRTGNLECQSL